MKIFLICANILLLIVSSFLAYKVLVKPDPDVQIFYIDLPDSRVAGCIAKLGVLESNYIDFFDVYYERNRKRFTDKQLVKMYIIKAHYAQGKAFHYYNTLIEGLGGEE
jgi:hypothetical protein